jgi:hypothetical protein
MLTRGSIPPLFYHDYRPQHRAVILPTRVQMVQTPKEDHQRSGSPIYIPLRQSIDKTAGYKPKPLDGGTPPNRWTVGTEEPVGRTILVTCNLGRTRHMG